MSELSEAIERAEKRLATMSEGDRVKYYAIILREELQRERDCRSPSLESPQP